MTWRGYLYTGVVGLIVLSAVGLIIAGVWPAPAELETLVGSVDEALKAEDWMRAEDDVRKLEMIWRRSRMYLSLDAGEDNLDEFETALRNLTVEIEERRRSEARIHLSTLRAILPKL